MGGGWTMRKKTTIETRPNAGNNSQVFLRRTFVIPIVGVMALIGSCKSQMDTACVDPSSPECQLLKEASGDAPSYESTVTSNTTTTVDPDGTLKALPTGITNRTKFRIDISTTKVQGKYIRGYQYKVGPSAQDCANEDGYGKKTSSTALLEFDVSAMPDGKIDICFRTMDADRNWQALDTVVAAS